jgi:uncharacterized protein (DUF3084 family)
VAIARRFCFRCSTPCYPDLRLAHSKVQGELERCRCDLHDVKSELVESESLRDRAVTERDQARMDLATAEVDRQWLNRLNRDLLNLD